MGGIKLKRFLIVGLVLLLVVIVGVFVQAEVVEGDPFKGLELYIAYDFDFWTENDPSIGTRDDADVFFEDSPQAGVSVIFTGSTEGAFKDKGKQEGLAFKHESIWEAGQDKNYIAFSLPQRHDYNLYGFDEFPDPQFFTIYVDTSKFNRKLEFYPIIYEQDYDDEGAEAGVSCMAIKAGATYYLKDKNGTLTSAKSFDNWVSLPKGFVGRIYLPLKDYGAIWGTSDVNNKFDGLKVYRYKFSLVDIGNKGDIIYFDEFGFLL